VNLDGEWRQRPLREIVCKLVDGSHNPPPKQEHGYPMLSARNVENGRIAFSDFRYVDQAAFQEENRRTRIAPGDILLTIVGSIGRSVVVPAGLPRFALQRSVAVLSPNSGVVPHFLCYQMQSPAVQRYLERNARGTAQKGVYLKTLGATPISVPGIPTQRRIVADLETQFSRLDEAVANLQRVKANLRRYESSILKSAFDGALVDTEASIAARHRRSYESGADVLRRAIEIGHAHRNGNRRSARASQMRIGDLPPLPEGWCWAQLGDIAAVKGGITVDSKRTDPTVRLVPYLRVANVQRGYLDLSELKQINAPAGDVDVLRLECGDILFNEGGDRDKLGRGWIWEDQVPECIHQNHVFRARLFLREFSPKLVSWWGNTFGKNYFLRHGKQTTNLASINLTKLMELPVPVPPIAEQRRIVAEVDRRLSIIRELEAEVDANLKRAHGLRAGILSKAFSP
jgi:type I restriction enzyme, S subunit